jgi:hypothetical protein
VDIVDRMEIVDKVDEYVHYVHLVHVASTEIRQTVTIPVFCRQAEFITITYHDS